MHNLFSFETSFNGSPIKDSMLQIISPDELKVGDEIAITKSVLNNSVGLYRNYLGEMFVPVIVESITPKRTKMSVCDKNSGKKVLSEELNEYMKDFGTLYKYIPEMDVYNKGFLTRKLLIQYLQKAQTCLFSNHKENHRRICAQEVITQVFNMPEEKVVELLDKFQFICDRVEELAEEAIQTSEERRKAWERI